MRVIYAIDELKERIAPVARNFRLPAVYLFGSYARGDATDKSDVDILIDKTGTQLRGLFAMGGLHEELIEAAAGKQVDLITTNALEERTRRNGDLGSTKTLTEKK